MFSYVVDSYSKTFANFAIFQQNNQDLGTVTAIIIIL